MRNKGKKKKKVPHYSKAQGKTALGDKCGRAGAVQGRQRRGGQGDWCERQTSALGHSV